MEEVEQKMEGRSVDGLVRLIEGNGYGFFRGSTFFDRALGAIATLRARCIVAGIDVQDVDLFLERREG